MGKAFGSAYGNEINWVQAGAAQNTWYEISDADMEDGELHLINHDGSGELTVIQAGYYLATYSVCLDDSDNNDHAEAGFYVDGAAVDAGQQHDETGRAGDHLAMSSTTILKLTAISTVAVCVRTIDATGPDFEVHHLNLTLTQAGWD